MRDMIYIEIRFCSTFMPESSQLDKLYYYIIMDCVTALLHSTLPYTTNLSASENLNPELIKPLRTAKRQKQRRIVPSTQHSISTIEAIRYRSLATIRTGLSSYQVPVSSFCCRLLRAHRSSVVCTYNG